MRKPSFGVVSGVVIALAGFGAGLKVLTPYLPPQRENALSVEKADFLKQGSRQAVDWHSVSPDVFAEARRLDRPMLLVIGCAYSHFGRFFDRQIFTDAEVQALLARNFLCVRIDGIDRPEWLSAYLPLSRAKKNFFVGLQIYVLDQTGKLVDVIDRQSVADFNAQKFLDLLLRSLEKLELIRKADPMTPPAGADQFADTQSLIQGSPMSRDTFDEFAQQLMSFCDPKYGGFPRGQNQLLFPSAWRLQLLLNKVEDFKKSFDPLAASAMVDWLDGGFFKSSTERDYSDVEFDKIATVNAEMGVVLAIAYQRTHDPAYHYLAQQTFKSLTTEFMASGYVSACRIGDEVQLDRSNHSSFSMRRLREMARDNAISQTDLDWAVSNFSLDPQVNSQMLIRAKDMHIIWRQAEQFGRSIAAFRARASIFRAPFSSGNYLDVQGSVAARVMEGARMLQDRDLALAGSAIYDQLENLRDGDDVRHSDSPDRNSVPTLLDYLAYADAALQDYLTTGRSVSLNRGYVVLKRALFKFSSNVPGVYNTGSRPAGEPWPENVTTPEVIDNVGESAIAKVIRLANAYSKLIPDNESNSTQVRLAQVASLVSEHFAGFADQLTVNAAGMVASVWEAAWFNYAICGGPNALVDSAALQRELPGRLAAPAIGTVRQDIQHKLPGIYVISGQQVRGPLSRPDALAALQQN